VSESRTGENDVTGFFGDLAVYLSKAPYATTTFFAEVVKALDEELNDSKDINDEARATIKYFLGKVVRALSVFFNLYDKPVLKDYIVNSGNLIRVTQALGDVVRAYRLLVTEDLSDNTPVVEDIASSLDNASALLESAVTTALVELSEKLASSNCPTTITELLDLSSLTSFFHLSIARRSSKVFKGRPTLLNRPGRGR